MTKISLNNFVIPYFIIKAACRDVGAYPIDISIDISNKAEQDVSPLVFNISAVMPRKQINLTIVNKYLTNFNNIHGFSLDPSVIQGALSSCSALCDMYFDNTEYNIPPSDTWPENFPFNFIASKINIFPNNSNKKDIKLSFPLFTNIVNKNSKPIINTRKRFKIIFCNNKLN